MKEPNYKKIPAGREYYYRRLFSVLILIAFFALMPGKAFSQSQDPKVLKKLSLEELLNIEVISVSLRPEKITEVASAVQVITGEDIHRSSVTRLPEALQLASNLQVAHVNSHDWAITARGFSGLPSAGGILANKLLVMIDGRSIYNPLFGGVYWDVQNTLLESVDRIEVISGPGGTLWGANAVNGVINVVTKSAGETQGLYVSGAGGSFLKDHVQARYGFHKGSTFFCRVYGQRFDQKNTFLENGMSSGDAWNMTQTGFRMDYFPSKATTITLQGDFYEGDENNSIKRAITDGQNVMAHLTHLFSDKSDLKVNVYYDRTWRITPNSTQPFSYNLNTYNFDVQYHYPIGKKQNLLVGMNYQFQQDKIARTLSPLSRNMPLFSGFVQDEIGIVPDVLKLTVGSKFLNNVFTGFEVQPGARIGWTPNMLHTIWAAVSRAVRVPTRFDADITVTDKKFDSEKVIAYELGYRIRPLDRVTLSLATFYNHYNDLRSLDKTTDPKFPIILANSQKANSWGVELSGNMQVTKRWRLRGGYTYFDRYIWSTNDNVLPISVEFESIDPKNTVLLQSVLDLPKNFQLDVMARYVSELSAGTLAPKTPAYFTFDARIAWLFRSFEISLAGQNLFGDEHTEVGLSRIPRSIYGKISYHF